MRMGLLQRLRLHSPGTSDASTWINEDIKPLPPHRRTWGTWTFVSFWAINNLIIRNFTTGSTLVGYGLSVWQAMIAVVLGKCIVVFVAIFNGWVGAEWHIGFPVISRYVWGMYGSYIILAQRILLSCVWMACQGWTGGLCISAILSAVIPAYHKMSNTLPENTHMDTKQFVGFILFCLLTCTVLWIPPERTRIFFLIVNVSAFLTMTGIMIWAVVTAHGAGTLLVEPAQVRGFAATGWAVVQGVTAVIGAIALGLSNQPDYSRFATRPGVQVTGQLISIPLIGTAIALFGCITASATQTIYGEVIWNPPILMSRWLEDNYTIRTRIGVFFCGHGLVISQLGINLIDNAYSGGMDLAGLLPQWINIRRGAYITLCLSILLQPWQLLSTASVFISVMSAYSVFLGPLVGFMITDYWLIRRRKIKLSDLYMPKNFSIYWYWHGINPRAFLAWVCGFAPLLPGFVAHINPDIHVSKGATQLYFLAFPAGFVISAVVFYLLSSFFPPAGLGVVDEYDYYNTFTEAEAKKLGVARQV